MKSDVMKIEMIRVSAIILLLIGGCAIPPGSITSVKGKHSQYHSICVISTMSNLEDRGAFETAVAYFLNSNHVSARRAMDEFPFESVASISPAQLLQHGFDAALVVGYSGSETSTSTSYDASTNTYNTQKVTNAIDGAAALLDSTGEKVYEASMRAPEYRSMLWGLVRDLFANGYFPVPKGGIRQPTSNSFYHGTQ